MAIGNLVPWRWGSLRSFDEDRSFGDFRAEIDSLQPSIDRLPGKAKYEGHDDLLVPERGGRVTEDAVVAYLLAVI